MRICVEEWFVFDESKPTFSLKTMFQIEKSDFLYYKKGTILKSVYVQWSVMAVQAIGSPRCKLVDISYSLVVQFTGH